MSPLTAMDLLSKRIFLYFWKNCMTIFFIHPLSKNMISNESPRDLATTEQASFLIFVKWIGDERCGKFDIVIRTVREDNCLLDIILPLLKN